MNKTISIILGVLILVIIGGVAVYSMKGDDSSDIATTTPDVIVNNNTNTNTTTQPQATLPIAVTNSSVSPSDTTAIVNGSVNPKGAFTSYWYEYGNTADLGSKTGNQTMGSGFVSISAPGYITNLVKNTTYYFRLIAENQYGRAAGSQFTFKTTEGNPPPVGSIPTTKSISANSISRASASLRGEVTPNKNMTQYWFEYGKTAELGNVSAFSTAGEGSAKVPVFISLSELEPLTTYYFRVNAQNQFGTVNGSILNFKTLGPVSVKVPSVTTGSATAVTKESAVLHGAIVPNGAETKYWFEYTTHSSLSSETPKTTDPVSVGAGLTAVPVDKSVAGLFSNATYYFRIVAQNSQGIVRGDEVTFKTK